MRARLSNLLRRSSSGVYFKVGIGTVISSVTFITWSRAEELSEQLSVLDRNQHQLNLEFNVLKTQIDTYNLAQMRQTQNEHTTEITVLYAKK
jgi:hypothetical protein